MDRKVIVPFTLAIFVGFLLIAIVGYAVDNRSSDSITGFAVDEHEYGVDDTHDESMQTPEMAMEEDEHSEDERAMAMPAAFDKAKLTTIIIFFFLILGFAVMFIAWFKTHGHEEGKKINLLDFPFVKKFVKSKFYPISFQLLTTAVFLLVIYLGFFDTQDGGKNLATILTWLIWWTLLIFLILFLGRVWCMACPFQFVGDIAQKIFCLNKKLPHKYRNLWITIFGFLFLTWGFAYWNMGGNPFATAVMSVVIILGSIVVSMIFIKRTFCRNFCPIGGMIGIYSMVAPIELTVKEKNNKPPCQVACPVSQNVKGYMSLIASNKFDQAAELIRRDNPLPSVCGRVCDHPCEIVCTRNDLEKQPLSIKALKRAAMDYGAKKE